ncbi:MAG TPA: response regulator transcription factor [Chthoniobacteraceae bacterium]|jgi:DNA-binding NarL/FixJ family response regulator
MATLTCTVPQDRSFLPQAAAQVRVLIVDDHALFRRGLVSLVEADPGFTVCGEVANADHALAAVREMQPDLAIVDVSLAGADGIELVKSMKEERPAMQILVLSMHEESIFALRALGAGARAYIIKQDAPENVVAALRAVTKGESFLSPRFRNQLAFKSLQAMEAGKGSPVDRLTPRESDVLQHLGHGRGTREIAEALELSVKTVETHRAHIKEKLNFRSNDEMVHFAVDWMVQQQS